MNDIEAYQKMASLQFIEPRHLEIKDKNVSNLWLDAEERKTFLMFNYLFIFFFFLK